jgi:DNA-binding transcriptional regulator YhcF (GntR family)
MREGDKVVRNCLVKQTRNEYGDFTSEEKDYSYRLPVEPDFVKMYTKDVADLNGIKGTNREVLTFMASMMDYENKVVISAPERRRWAKELDVSYHSINNAISFLKKHGHITSPGTGEYVVSPTMFSKGDWKKTMQKREDFDAHFVVSYKKTEAGFSRTVRQANVRPIAMKIDLETGRPLYKYTRSGTFEEKRHESGIIDEIKDAPF